MIIGHGWNIWASEKTSQIHVMPVDDYRPHDFTATCWCGATPDHENVVTHHSLDNREMYENLPLQ